MRLAKPLWILLIAAAAACGDDDATGPANADVAGTWSFTQSLDNAQIGVSCDGTGTFTLQQTGGELSGTYESSGTCTAQGQTIPDTRSGPLDGDVDGDEIELTVQTSAGSCRYTGTASGSPATRLAGDASCTGTISGFQVGLTGTWEATRQ